MSVKGKLLINGEWLDGRADSYHATNPATGNSIEPSMSTASSEQVDIALAAAEQAAAIFRNSSLQKRADFLRECADEIMALGNILIERITAETGYPAARGQMERGRTCNQLRMFADYILDGDYLDARIETALPDRQPLPRPDLRHLNQALGPVVVFGASNFPMAYSVAGGDTAAAFAAGCPVLVKGHSSHPGTSELVAQAIDNARKKCELPAGVFSLLMGSGSKVGAALVKAPAVKAVGFTGSFAGGMALVEIANSRPEPIPVFAEMGSINPVILLPKALEDRAQAIAEGFVGSLTLGTGQFCVNPGLLIAIDDEGLTNFIDAASKIVADTQAGVMLNERICSSYSDGLKEYSSHEGVEVISSGASTENKDGYCGQATLMTATAEYFLQNPKIHEEVFGPASLIVKCQNKDEILKVISELQGQLTGTIHCADNELANYQELSDLLTIKVGRVVINGFPTGVEVCHSMVHGGPFPASSDSRFTSVGSNAILRFIRPVCYQNFPENLLPEALRNSNPLGLTRLINGKKSNSEI